MICVIPARGGSQRIPNKNIRSFHGKPIIAYSIELGRGACTRTIVSTDSDEIGAVAMAYGAEVCERPSELARDEIGTQAVVRHVVEELALEGDIMALYATSPLLTKADVEYAWHAYVYGPRMICRYSATSYGDPTGGFYIARHDFFLYELDPYSFGLLWPTADIDINTPSDWELAEKLYEEIYQ